MTFRSPARSLALCVLLTLGMAVLAVLTGNEFISKWKDAGGQGRAYRFGGSLALVGCGVFATWLFWSARVTVEEGGVRWQEGKTRGFLPWDAIQGFGHRRAHNTLRIGLVEKATGEIRFLPVMNAEIYRLLLPRCGPLPPEIVREAKLG